MVLGDVRREALCLGATLAEAEQGDHAFVDFRAIVDAALGSAAYYFGSVLEGMLGNIKKYELMVLGGLIVLGLLLWLWRRFKTPRGNGAGGNADKSE